MSADKTASKPSDEPIYFAWDGSLHGEWISRYALRIAAHSPMRALVALHVPGARGAAEPRTRREPFERDADALGVALRFDDLPGADAAAALRDAVPEGALLVCGTRNRDRGRGLLFGSVAAALLKRPACDVWAFKVLDPGNLGLPRRLLLPLAGSGTGIETALPFVQRLAPDLDLLTLCHVVTLGRFAYRHLTIARARQHEHEASLQLRAEQARLRQALGDGTPRIDTRPLVSADWPADVLLMAARIHARHVLLGATAHALPGRFAFGNALERVLRSAVTDVSILRPGVRRS